MGTAEALLRDIFGLPLLAYLCASEESEVEGRLTGVNDLRPAAEAVLRDALLPLAERAASAATAESRFPVSMELSALGRHHGQHGTSVGNALRVAAGGTLPDADALTDDELGRALVRMAVDEYPVLLVPTDALEPGPPLVGLFDHPEGDRVISLVVADANLVRLFPDEDEGLGSGRIGMVYSSLGSGGTFQTALFASVLIRSAWTAAGMNVATPTVDEVAARVLTHLDIVRRAASGEVTEVRALVAFTGFTTPGIEIKTPWGQLRPLSERERQLAPPILEGLVSGTHPDGAHVTVSYAGELVLDTLVPYALHADHHKPSEMRPFPNVRGTGVVGERIEAIQLAGLLTVDSAPGTYLIARVAWTEIADPIAHGRRISWSDTRAQPAFVPHELTRDEAAAFAEWCELIATHRPANAAIALRRVISAAHVRTAPTDRLVDAVIAWENLFGTSQGEVTLRVSSALAWLLEPDDPGARTALFRRLTRLYTRRSTIVHGGAVDDREVVSDSDEAFRTALRAFAVLFRDRRDVLSAGDGAARSLALLLGQD